MLNIKIGPQEEEACPVCDQVDCQHAKAMRRLSQLELFAIFYRLQQHLRFEEEEQSHDDIPTEFEKWWHTYTQGQVNTRDQKIGDDAWHAAQDAFVELAAIQIEKEISLETTLREIAGRAKRDGAK